MQPDPFLVPWCFHGLGSAVGLGDSTGSHRMPHVAALQDEWPGVDMNVESELLWPGVALLLLLGTVAGLCVRCSRPGKGAVERGPGGAQSVKRLPSARVTIPGSWD